jgi:hypothetical protein
MGGPSESQESGSNGWPFFPTPCPFNQASGATLFARGGRTKSSLCAGEGRPAYQVSASWLNRPERKNTNLPLTNSLSWYSLSIERLIRSMYPGDAQPLSLRHCSSPNATMLSTEGPLDEQAKYLLPDTLSLDLPPDETTLLAAENSSTPYRRGIIGMRDHTLDPMIPAGSIVQIDTQKRCDFFPQRLDA